MIRRTYKNRDSLIPTVQTVVSILNDKINFLDTSLSDYGNKDGKGDINGDINDNINDNYTRVCPIVKASIGQHVRHSLHHITLSTLPLLTPSTSSPPPLIEYDERVRGDLVETDVKHARSAMKTLVTDLSNFLLQPSTPSSISSTAPVSVSFFLSPTSPPSTLAYTSTLSREVAFSAHHALHHMAMMRVIAENSIGGIVEEGFGVANGTKIWREQEMKKNSIDGVHGLSSARRTFSTSVGVSVSDAPSDEIKYFTAWFCPFAHRCTMALEHHKGHVGYVWKESLGWEKRDNEDGEVGNGKDWYYHWKSEELMECNPAGMVPTLLLPDGRVVSESIVTVEYVDNHVRMKGGREDEEMLVPREDPVEEARGRVWSDKVAREMCSPYYKILVRQEEEEQREGLRELLEGMERFSKELRKTEGRLFMEGERIGIVDITLFPWAWRYYVFEHYRGEDFAIKRGGKAVSGWDVEPFFDWLDCMMEKDSVTRTLPDMERYLDHIGKYASGSARSKVAEAVRRGVSAHEYDDKKDMRD